MSVFQVAGSTWDTLATPDDSVPALFDHGTLADLPEPAARWLAHAVPDCSPLFSAVEITMSGTIKLGSRWWPFTADQVLRAGVGFVWKPVVGNRLLRFVGADILGPDEAQMEFRFHGLVPVAKASGDDVARSASGRLAAETVAWIPQAATPQAGAVWTPVDDRRAIVTLEAADESVDVQVNIGPDGRLNSVRLDRWNEDSDPPKFEPFGGVMSRDYTTDAGVRVADCGSVGWGYGTSAWDDGGFFRYKIDSLEPIRPR